VGERTGSSPRGGGPEHLTNVCWPNQRVRWEGVKQRKIGNRGESAP